MAVDIICVAVCSHQYLHSRPRTGGELFRHLMRLLGCDIFSVREGLHVLIEVGAVQFPVRCFRGFKLQNGISAIAVDAADKELL